MWYLVVLALVSLVGIVFMLARKIQQTAPQIETAGRHAHTNFISESLKVVQKWARKSANNAYLKMRPHAHDAVAFLVSKMYKISSWLAREFLKFYNFIQGRKVLKSTGHTSVFIRDLTTK